MKHSKVNQVLASLNSSEIKEFRHFVNSPYFNSNRNLCRMIDILFAHYPEFDASKIEKEKIFAKLFPGKNYNEQVMKNLSSGLLQLSLEFLGINKYKNRSRYDNELDILNELNDKRLDNIFDIRLKRIEKDLSDSTHMIHPLFYHLHRMETIKTQFLLSRDKQKFAAENVLKAGDYLIYYFITEFSRIAIDINANISSFNAKHNVNLVQEVLDKFDFGHIIKYLIENNYEYSRILNVYYHRLLALLDCSDKNYFAFKELLIESAAKFSHRELASLLDSLHNMAIQRSNDGADDSGREEFEVIKMELEYNTITLRSGGRISLLSFRNVIFASVRLNETEWAEGFIEKYISRVNEDSRESIYNHARGILDFVKKDYDNAVKHLGKVEMINPFLISDVKTHMAIIYFEQGHYDSCISVLDSFRHILTGREEFTNIFREVNVHFINAVTAMIKVSSGAKKKETLLRLKEKLNSLKLVNHKKWLLRKADEMLTEN